MKQSDKLESIQKTCLRVILGDMYISYTAALEMTGLQTLYDRRQDRCLKFALKSTKIPLGKRLFPLNHVDNGRSIRSREKFKVNFARTEDYRKSTVPFCQQLLNQHFKSIWVTFAFMLCFHFSVNYSQVYGSSQLYYNKQQ